MAGQVSERPYYHMLHAWKVFSCVLYFSRSLLNLMFGVKCVLIWSCLVETFCKRLAQSFVDWALGVLERNTLLFRNFTENFGLSTLIIRKL